MKILLLILLFSCNFIYSQVGVKILHARPTDDFGFAVKPTISGEIIYKKINSKKKLVSRFGIGFIRFSPRLDTFPVRGVLVTYGNSSSVPGKLAPSPCNYFYGNIGLDYKIKINDSICFYPGLDINMGRTMSKHYEFYPMISDGYYEDNRIILGGGIRIGLEYIYKRKFAFFIEVERNINKILYYELLNYNEYACGIRIKLKK